MTKNFETIRQEAIDALAAGDPQAAFTTFRAVLDYPGKLRGRRRWGEALSVFARIGAAISGEEFAAVVRAAAADPNHMQALYDLGYQLIEHGLPGIAATVLARANEMAPGEEPILTELVAALERDLRYAEAARLLRAAPELIQRSFLCSYLLAFNALMSGDLEEPRRQLPALQENTNPDYALMVERITGMLRRADALRDVCPLDAKDLRGWHFVITGSLLLHLSPFGFDEGMNGRYAFYQDSGLCCLEGIRRLAAVLDCWDLHPPRVFVLPDRDSAALAHAAARVLSLPVDIWPEEGNSSPGLIVAYDLGKLPDSVVPALQAHCPGQVLWTHASCWTSEPPFAADLATYLYQVNVSPWESRLRINPDTNQTERMPPREGAVEDLATEVAAAQLEPEALDDLPALLALARAARRVQGEHRPGALLGEGNRRRQWLGSPVPSNRFPD